MQRAYGLEIPRTVEEACRPERLALIVYDMQVGILRQVQNGPALTANVTEAIAVAREAGVRVVYTRHMSLPKELTGMAQLRMALAWQRKDRVEDVAPWFLRDSP